MIRRILFAAAFSVSGFCFAEGETEKTTTTTTTNTTTTTAGATSFTCTSGETTRSIKVEYDTPSAKVPCRVSYTKPEGVETPWTASSMEGYCEEKAQGLADKLTTNGWDCKTAM